MGVPHPAAERQRQTWTVFKGSASPGQAGQGLSESHPAYWLVYWRTTLWGHSSLCPSLWFITRSCEQGVLDVTLIRDVILTLHLIPILDPIRDLLLCLASSQSQPKTHPKRVGVGSGPRYPMRQKWQIVILSANLQARCATQHRSSAGDPPPPPQVTGVTVTSDRTEHGTTTAPTTAALSLAARVECGLQYRAQAISSQSAKQIMNPSSRRTTYNKLETAASPPPPKQWLGGLR